MTVTFLNNDNFREEVLNCPKTVLIDFYADWCMPCRMQSPIIDELAEDLGDKLKVCKVNVDQQPELAQAFGVSSIPMLAVMKQGHLMSSVVGTRSREEIEKMLYL